MFGGLRATLIFASALICASFVSAGTVWVTPGGSTTETDNNTNLPVSAVVSFAISGNQLTVTIQNTTSDPYFDSQNITALAFDLSGATDALAGTTTTDTGASVVNKTGTPGSFISDGTNPLSFSTTTDNITWNTGQVTAMGADSMFGGATVPTSGAFVLYAPSSGMSGFGVDDGTGMNQWNAIDSIIGAPGGSTYSAFTTGCAYTTDSTCNTGSPLINPVTEGPSGMTSVYGVDQSEFISQIATFTFTITNLTSLQTISNVYIGYGPDGPDSDDWIQLQQQSTTPEPVSMLLCGAGLAAIGGMRRYSKRTR